MSNKSNQKLTIQLQSTHFIGKQIYHYKTLDSTNSKAKEIISNSKPQNGTAILTDFQTAGRGQMNTAWHSEVGKNLLVSIILKPESAPANSQFYLNKVVASSICDCLNQEYGIPALIKWPNDILVNHKKICGLLLENTIRDQYIHYSILGIGLNVNQEEFPLFTPEATSMSIVTGEAFSVYKILEHIAQSIEKNWQYFFENQRDYIEELYRKHLYGLDQPRDFLVQGKRKTGMIKSVDEWGRIHIHFCNGEQIFQNKEVAFLYD